MKNICLTGGGTAGHVMPHLALLPELKKHFDNIVYVGSFNGIEKDIIKHEANLPYYHITTTKLRRSLSLKNLAIPFLLIKGICQAKKILKQNKIQVVFSKGGFVSVPVVIAAKKLKIPIVSHESDITLGLANKIILRYANKMCVSFETTEKETKGKGVYTGSPIRQEIYNGNKQNIFNKYNFDEDKSTLLFMGGSLGAKAINEQVFKLANNLVKEFNILHLTGKNKRNNDLLHLKNYKQVEYTNKIEDFYTAADLVICRAGSNVIFELLALEKPMLLIPLSKLESRGDQILNANHFKEKGWAKVLMQEDLNASSLNQKIKQTLADKQTLIKNMNNSDFTNGNKKIINEILLHTKTLKF